MKPFRDLAGVLRARCVGPGLLAALALVLAGCLVPVENEIALDEGDPKAPPLNTNETRLVIFNTSTYWSKFDHTGWINVILNGKGVGQLPPRYYVELIVPKGPYNMDLMHRANSDWFSQHRIVATDAITFVDIGVDPIGNRAEIVLELPQDFQKKYKMMRVR